MWTSEDNEVDGIIHSVVAHHSTHGNLGCTLSLLLVNVGKTDETNGCLGELPPQPLCSMAALYTALMLFSMEAQEELCYSILTCSTGFV